MSNTRASRLALFFVYFLDYFGYAIVFGFFGPLILKPEFGMVTENLSLQERHLLLALLFAVFPLLQFFTSPLFGDLADRYGRKKLLYLSMTGNIGGYLLSGFSIGIHSFPLLLLSRSISGFFSGNRSICLTAIADLSPGEASRSKSYGMLATLGGFSWILSMFIGGYFSNAPALSCFTAASPFWITAGLTSISLMTLVLFFSETHIPEKHTPLNFLKGFQNIKRCFQKEELKTLYPFYFLFMVGWSINLLWLNPYIIAKFSISQIHIIYLLIGTGLSWSIGSMGINKLLIQRKTASQITKIGLYGLIVTFFIASQISSYPLFACLALLASIFGSLSWTNILSIISLSSSEKNQGKAMGISQSMGSMSMLIAPLIAGGVAAYKIELVYPIAALFTLASLIVFSNSYAKKMYASE
jgi:DHA1 family tetracycline resistance protein-like MFS transporter